ncbi:GGDEF domain-containing protein [Pseudomonas viridiflava]|uniref:GGDEF domain-containing protein n=1 Tax=Pseudomonas syringae group TaxID=136849 RepID=UPI000F06D8CF|nr:GGDEF domain-containing protein [Pseudomonas viridiflava]
MKIKKLKYISEEIVTFIAKDQATADIFYEFNSEWHSITGQAVPSNLREHLDLSRKNPSHYFPDGNTGFYYCEDSKYSVRVKFIASPRRPRRDKVRKTIDEAINVAINRYKVGHSSLTDLLAKDAFSFHLDEAIAGLSSNAALVGDHHEAGSPPALGVLAIDIDFFKQVNDTWGHIYGDQVLKAFGYRLDAAAQKIIETEETAVKIHVGHPSGEEFLIAIEAATNKERFREWATQFRKAIADDPLPSENEWKMLSLDSVPAGLYPPPLAERRITASVGVYFHSGILPESSTRVVSEFLEKSDTALYRAKAGGRDQVIFYDDILTRCGRILEQDHGSGVVAVDIGSDVGVEEGQEFKIFSPTFTGEKKFVVDNGRTTRALGYYPRVESGRLTVFNVQSELSFAYISSLDKTASFEIGSHLEAVPAGSIRHLLSGFSKYFPSKSESEEINALEKTQRYVVEAAASKEKPFAIVINLSKQSGYVRMFGIGSLNDALVKIYRAAQVRFPAVRYVEVIDSSSICIVGAGTLYNEDKVSEFVELMRHEHPDLGILAGVFCEKDATPGKNINGEKLSHTHAIEFAQYASSELGRSSDLAVRHFGYLQVTDVLYALRNKGESKTAMTDYKKLQSFGLTSPNFVNQGGLISGSLGDDRGACKYYEEACLIAPGEIIYKLNLLVSLSRLGEYDQAINAVASIPVEEIRSKKLAHKYGFFAFAYSYAMAKLAESKTYDDLRFNAIADEAVAIGRSENYRGVGKIIKALTS